MLKIPTSAALIILNNKEMTNNIQSSPERSPGSLKESEEITNINQSDDEVPVTKTKKRVIKFSESDSSSDTEKNENLEAELRSRSELSDSHDDLATFKGSLGRATEKSRMHNVSSSDSDSQSEVVVCKKNEEQQIRMKNKKKNVKQKFNGLLESRGRKGGINKVVDSDSDSSVSNASDKLSSDLSSVDNIKKIIKERMSNLKSTICDTDTSDEEGMINIGINKKKKKSTKLIAPKPMRMSAKQAMESMHKIKSESNRMLREKEVSLPYHRPKALSLKDIISRRQPAVSSDGKALPIKMNDQQLRQYAKMLEQRQKEMIELCKSDTDEEQPDNDKILNITESNTDADPKDNNINSEETGNSDKETENSTQIDSNIQETEQIDNSIPNEEIVKDKVMENEDPNDTSTGDVSTEMPLVYNDSVEEQKETNEDTNEKDTIEMTIAEQTPKTNSNIFMETNSQNISLHLTEQYNTNTEPMYNVADVEDTENISTHTNKDKDCSEYCDKIDDFSDDDINMEDIDALIENTVIIKGTNEPVDSPMLIRDSLPYKEKPKLTGAPGMVIDLDGSDATAKKLSGVELLKERFSFFSKLKTPEEMEKDKEKRIKPGTLHIKLKQDLEQQIAEQRSLEWAKRLEEERQHHKELNALRGDESVEDEIDKIEAKLAENEIEESLSESEEEEELCEDKTRKQNPMIADEAEESDCEGEKSDCEGEIIKKDKNQTEDEVDQQISDSDESSDESSSDEETVEKPRKGRILKAFEDSDDEVIQPETNEVIKDGNKSAITDGLHKSHGPVMDSQDDELQLAQLQKSFSEDLFTSQDSSVIASNGPHEDSNKTNTDVEIPTQSFSILNSDEKDESIEISTQSFSNACKDSTKLSVITETQPFDENLDAIVGMCSGSFTQNLAPSLVEKPLSPSQDIGDDLLAMCTGKFYDNKLISQDNNGKSQLENEWNQDESQKIAEEISETPNEDQQANCTSEDRTLKSILDELDGPEFAAPKANKYFCGSTGNTENLNIKKRFVIDSDDEYKETVIESVRKKKLKKRKPEKRALQISDDEEEANDAIEQDMDDEDVLDLGEDEERLVEYDSEENEVLVAAVKPKKKRKTTEFFEQEAELTSEDEWVGSGDEDERGLDRMEREEGDDDHFHQGELQRELGQIHMRDVLDQDKREVRIIQELLFEDGDLGDGHRQRKFRWKDDDGNEESGTVPDLTDTQEEEFESEEIWRKQRHEREVFLKQMQQNDNETEDNLNISINRNAIIKANLSSRTISSLLVEVNKKIEDVENKQSLPVLKKTPKDVPSPKKPLAMFQQNYHGSILNRGSSALARLAAIATPLAGDEDARIGTLGPTNKRNFVFATLTQEDTEPKVTKRKAEANAGTPRLLKKMKTEEKQPLLKNSLLDHLKA